VGLFFNNLFVIYQRYENNRVYWYGLLLAFTTDLNQFFKILCPFADQKIDYILFFYEKFFRVEELVNSQNAYIYATSYGDIIEHMRSL